MDTAMKRAKIYRRKIVQNIRIYPFKFVSLQKTRENEQTNHR